MEKVFFYDDNHEYKTLSGLKYQSVSGLTHEYCNEFNDLHSSIVKAFRNHSEALYKSASKIHNYESPEIIEYMMGYVTEDEYQQILINADELRNNWKGIGDNASENGTEEHSKREKEDEDRGYKINPMDGRKYKVIPRAHGLGYDNMEILDDVLSMKEDICVLEALITDHDNIVAGQEDVLFLKYMGAGSFMGVNLDYKTDKSMDYLSFFNKGYKKMKGELSYFMDSNFWQYTIKMSIYAVMLEKKNVKVSKNILEHIHGNGKSTYIYPLIYRSHAIKILNNNKSKWQ